MTLTSAISSSITALQAQSASIAAISDNIANTQTTAYKNQEVSFASLLSGQSTGSTSYAASGVRYSTTQNLLAPGIIEAADLTTNVAIQGDGFFVVSDDVNSASANLSYTRNGSFSIDANGYLVNSEGYYLYGQATDADGNVIATNNNSLASLQPINVNGVTGTAQSTAEITMQANLPAEAAVGDSFTTAVEMYDSLGVSHTLDQTWTKTGANSWSLDLSDPYAAGDPATSTGTTSPTTINLTFNSDGTLATTAPDPVDITVTGLSSGAADSTFRLDLGSPGGADGLTQYASNADQPDIEIDFIEQDGARYGELSSMDISDEGIVTAHFDNGLSQAVYQIPVATFQNANGLTPVQGTVYQQTLDSGGLVLSNPGEGGSGSLVGGALEASAADETDEFNKLIVAQQAYSSSSKVITAADEMFDTLLNAIR